MDPNENLLRQVGLAEQIIRESEDCDAVALAEYVLALHDWRRKGGFDPYLSAPERCTACGFELDKHDDFDNRCPDPEGTL